MKKDLSKVKEVRYFGGYGWLGRVGRLTKTGAIWIFLTKNEAEVVARRKLKIRIWR